MKTWYIDEGIMTLRAIQPVAKKFGYHVTIGGGVVNKGMSNKDLDLWFLPLNGLNYREDNGGDPTTLLEVLEKMWGKSHKIDYPGDEPVPDRLLPDPLNNNAPLADNQQMMAGRWLGMQDVIVRGPDGGLRVERRVERQLVVPAVVEFRANVGNAPIQPVVPDNKEPRKRLYKYAVTFLRNGDERIDCFIL